MKNINHKKFLIFCFCVLFISLGYIKLFYFNGEDYSPEPNARNWMDYLPDSALIVNINFPGTHDSGTSKVTTLTELYAKCQTKSISNQLNSGIRYLDLRINEDGHINHDGISCWKSFSKKLYIQDVEKYVTDFLKGNPSETVILQIKSEGKGNCANIVNDKLTTNNLYYRKNRDIDTLRLGDVRGKFIIFSRQSGIKYAYNCYNWANNVSCGDLSIDFQSGYLQDKYNSTRPNKKEIIRKFYSKVWEDSNNAEKPVINFTSFTQIPFPLSSLYLDLNKYMSDFIAANNGKKLGFVLMDNPKNQLIKKIYQTNYNRNL